MESNVIPLLIVSAREVPGVKFWPRPVGSGHQPSEDLNKCGPTAFTFKRAGFGKKDRLLSENSALINAGTIRLPRRADHETT